VESTFTSERRPRREPEPRQCSEPWREATVYCTPQVLSSRTLPVPTADGFPTPCVCHHSSGRFSGCVLGTRPLCGELDPWMAVMMSLVLTPPVCLVFKPQRIFIDGGYHGTHQVIELLKRRASGDSLEASRLLLLARSFLEIERPACKAASLMTLFSITPKWSQKM
jgi:hypothetical protein